MSDWLSGLNSEQKEAVLHNCGPLLILAGAGSGKTTVLVSRAGRLISEKICPPQKLCVLTFTNKAARELKARVATRLGASGAKIWAGTFHSFGLFLIRKYATEGQSQVGIIDETDAASLAKELIADFHQGKTAYDARRLVEMMSHWRATGETKAKKDDEYEAAVEWLLPRYLKKLNQLGVVDFDELLRRPIELMEANAERRIEIQALFDQIMVDEFQDTNLPQMKLLDLLSAGHRNLTVVGDDDQAIYGWRGACVKNILDFPKRYAGCKVVSLETNYRSRSVILNLANAVIAKNSERYLKRLRAAKVGETELPEVVIHNDETEEAESIAAEVKNELGQGTHPAEIAVLYRSNSIGASLEAEFRKNQIPYAITGGTAFFDRKEPRDALAYLRLAFRPTDLSFRRVLCAPPRGIGEKTLLALEEFALANRMPLWRAAQKRSGVALDALFQEVEQLRAEVPLHPKKTLLGILETNGYRRHLEKAAGDSIKGVKRWRMVEIFADLLERFLQKSGSPSEFIDAMELRDAPDEEDRNKIQLMTLHASKGLEFKCVILVGVEEEILPHRTLGSDVAEERRLFYVGVTRAKEKLVLTRNRKRVRFGKAVDVVPSRFLVEIPSSLYSEREGIRPMAKEKRKALLAELYSQL